MTTTVTINPPTTQQTTLYYHAGSSDKVYHVRLEADRNNPDKFLVHFAYGRRGSTLQTGTKTPEAVDHDTALKLYNQLVAAKLAKGYSPGADGTPYQHTPLAGRSTGIVPQLLTAIPGTRVLGDLLADPLFCAQEKHDGKRLLLRKEGRTITGSNRRGLVVAVPDPLVQAALQLPGDFLLDGEAVGDTLYVFDLLELSGENVRANIYADRLGFLAELLLSGSPGAALQPVYTARTAREKTALYARLHAHGKEGIVLKRLTASYQPGKTSGSASSSLSSPSALTSAPALKYKFHESASFLVTVVHPTKRSVALGLYAGSEIVEAGHVTIPPNHPLPEPGSVVEVRYLYAFRESGAVYQPVYLGEREDIEPAECTTSQLKYRTEPSTAITIRV